MFVERAFAAAAMFEGDDNIWWITGGDNSDLLHYIESTEVFDVESNSFSFGADLPKEVAKHNLVNINSTHMVMLGGTDEDNEVFIFDRYVYNNQVVFFIGYWVLGRVTAL